MRTLILVLAALSARMAFGAEQLSDPKEILAKVKAAYSNCTSFSCDAVSVSTFKTAAPHTDRKTCEIRFRRPDHFRILWTTIWMGGDVQTNVVYRAGDKWLIYWGQLGRSVEQQESLDMAIAAATGVSSGLAYFIPSLLRGNPDPFHLTSLTKGDDVVIDSTPCYTVKGTQVGSEGSETYAIAKDTLLILQTSESVTIRREKSRALEEEALKRRPELAERLKGMPPRRDVPDFQVDQVVTYAANKLNPPLDDAAFTFQAPPAK